jgi:hypothetical protein
VKLEVVAYFFAEIGDGLITVIVSFSDFKVNLETVLGFFPRERWTIPMKKSNWLPFTSDFFRDYNGK